MIVLIGIATAAVIVAQLLHSLLARSKSPTVVVYGDAGPRGCSRGLGCVLLVLLVMMLLGSVLGSL